MAPEPKNELQRNAIVEARRKELEMYQRALDIQWLNSRMEDGRMGRCIALVKKEAEMEKDFQERTDHAAIVNARAEKEIALGIEIAKVQREEACKLLRRQYLRERDPSLRNLIKNLQAGYVCRDLQQQILHNQYKKLQEKAEENQANQFLYNSLHNDKEAKELEERAKLEKNRKYCLELQQQLVNRQSQRQCEYEEMLIEKKMLEDIMRTLADEDQRELKQKHEQMLKMRNEMVTFKQARDAWKDKQKKMVVLEEREIENQRRAASDRSADLIAKREQKVREKEELNKKISDKILADEAARLEREDLIKLLQEQEYLEKNVQDDKEEKEKLERVKKETKTALMTQMAEKKREQKMIRDRERDFRLSIEKKMAAEDAKAAEKERKEKEKRERYQRELKQQIKENELRREKERQLEESRVKKVFDCDKAWREEVSQEKQKILASHAANVVGYVRPGVLDGTQQSGPDARRSKCNAQCRVLREY
ncbi:putative Meiosis-specific nuclear structural 1 [Danaus plexippus plexippus]|uniref:Meiosis-specific nuclear structural protein 1 n=1 Tax=Danaus plexippus plexippus TaxID=278856 RepID=A0A212EYU8_DANPL|nr:putative Meiosis-specific nuclear structural 1 [Danaus plexippus plexippus]